MEDKLTLLYIDDEAINLKLFEINFRKKYDVITAPSGFEGLEILDENKSVSVVISDMRMPGMNGIEFINKAREKSNDLIYFILSGYDVTEEISDACKRGVIYKYFQKPFNMREIEDSIREAMDIKTHGWSAS